VKPHPCLRFELIRCVLHGDVSSPGAVAGGTRRRGISLLARGRMPAGARGMRALWARAGRAGSDMLWLTPPDDGEPVLCLVCPGRWKSAIETPKDRT
jgi:hypothetical protein